jgi:hypothetical protein
MSTIDVNLDKACVRCGRKGATPGGLCMACITDSIRKGGDMEVKVIIRNISKLKTTTAMVEEKDKDGEIVDRRLVTKITFEAEVGPQELMNVHRLLAVESPVSVVIGSPQSVMTVMEEEGAFAEA